jgi:lysophospholipase L1-like esterase
MRYRVLMIVVLTALALTAGCQGSSEKPPPPPGQAGYVALGDSYVSGPGIEKVDTTSPYCLRGTQNYPHLLAKKLKPRHFVDVSCGGETTQMMQAGRTFANGSTIVAPQLDAVGPKTSLVTVGIGGNDGGGSAALFKYCLIPATANDSQCRTFVSTYMPNVYPQTRDNVVDLLGEIKARAPHARVVLVGYLRIAPEQGSCALLPLTDVRRTATLEWETQMDATLRDAAKRAHVPFVDVRKISRGHDACAGKEAWVNGIKNDPGQGGFLHPRPAGMRAVADEVLKTVRK